MISNCYLKLNKNENSEDKSGVSLWLNDWRSLKKELLRNCKWEEEEEKEEEWSTATTTMTTTCSTWLSTRLDSAQLSNAAAAAAAATCSLAPSRIFTVPSVNRIIVARASAAAAAAAAAVDGYFEFIYVPHLTASFLKVLFIPVSSRVSRVCPKGPL